MNKKLAFLPLLAVLTLALGGCTGGNNGGDVDDDDNFLPETPEPTTFGGYERVTTLPENGATYLLGIYQRSKEEMIFMNGKPHTDSNGTYEYYFSCNEYEIYDDTAEIEVGACEIKVEYDGAPVNGIQYFNLYVVPGTGAGNYYDGKYIYSYGDADTVTDPDTGDVAVQKRYWSIMADDQKATNTDTNKSYKWWWNVNADDSGRDWITSTFKHKYLNDDEWTIGLGTHGTYTSIECEKQEYNNFKDDFPAHLWKKVA